VWSRAPGSRYRLGYRSCVEKRAVIDPHISTGPQRSIPRGPHEFKVIDLDATNQLGQVSHVYVQK